ncbi:hypothetical protein MMIN_10520 [Mycolicibacter minnesotensis]|nr:hypothetical protein MMIN_10520 [Mycolicibacter minnesotensis]
MVERRRPTRDCGSAEPPIGEPHFLYGTRCHILFRDCDRHDSRLSNPTVREACVMDQNQQNDTAEIVTETLVEEVSIDGMCGVY